MASWDSSPFTKTDGSPAESFISTPGEMYPPLFSDSTPATTTVNPMDMMTPPSPADESKTDVTMVLSSSSGPSTISPPPPEAPSTGSQNSDDASTEKKPVKKRKSWGQVLPEPKTNLPPRKRAKTEDEKEQRRVERVLRNRRAAQSSRERKRQEVEALEMRNKELEARLHDIEKANLMLLEELHKFRRINGVVPCSSSLDSLRADPVTLSQELFSSQDGHKPFFDTKATYLSELVASQSSTVTINPSSLSPEPSLPAKEAGSNNDHCGNNNPAITIKATTGMTEESATKSLVPDMTQRPAAMLCDLQCQQLGSLARWWTTLLPNAVLMSFLQLQVFLIASSTILSICRRPLTRIALSLKAGFSLPPVPSILNTIIWLVTRPRSSQSMGSTTPSSSRRKLMDPRLTPRRLVACPSQRTLTSSSTLPTLRTNSLRKILTCSPNLARPLQDATMEALRLVSEGYGDLVSKPMVTEWSILRGDMSTPPECHSRLRPPSKEALLALLWALKMESLKKEKRQRHQTCLAT